MEDFRQNLLREHQHQRIDASQKQMVSPIWRTGGPGLSRQKIRRGSILESRSVEKHVQSVCIKGTGVRFLTFRTGYLHLKTASK
jgi:hypothetical protein